MADILKEIQNPKGRVFRRLYLKRRLLATGLFETDWQELTTDVKRWGRISKSIDATRYSRVRFSDANVVVANDYGRYNPEDDESSLWSGYAAQNRSLVKIEAGFLAQTLSASGIYSNTFLPADPTIFVGVIQGDITLSDENEVALPIKPLLQVFRDFSCRNLTGLTSAGMTAWQFIQTLQNQTDGSGDFIFRPFFGNTTSYWDYTSSAIVYKDLTTNPESAQPNDGTPVQNDFLEMSVWDAIERLAEAENSIPYITRDGRFRFRDRSANTTTAAFAFYGRGFSDRRYGQTIKKVKGYTKKISDFYSRVELKWNDLATTTSVVSTQTAMAVDGSNDAWNYGHRTYSFDNPWVATVTSARTLANAVFTAVSTVNRELNFLTSFVPHLEVLDMVSMNYDSTEAEPNSRWDLADWAADDTDTSTDLIWAADAAMSFVNDEFKLTSIDIDLDRLECEFIAIKTGGVGRNVGGNTVGSAIVGDAVLG